MSELQSTATPPAAASGEERTSALFAQLIAQQSSLALMLMGKGGHPEGGEAVRDFEAARACIDQLEMIEAKTKGNLTREEASFLRQTLMATRMAFVEAVEEPAGGQPPAAASKSPETPKPEAAPESPSAEDEHRKKFTKKY